MMPAEDPLAASRGCALACVSGVLFWLTLAALAVWRWGW